jgi:DnaJ-class molecular chaperone
MFKDYYALLEIEQNASSNEIKKSFRKQALKWHPDRNPNEDTTIRMQELNEAALVIQDDEARRRYDIEYSRFSRFRKSQEEAKAKNFEQSHKNEDGSSKSSFEQNEFDYKYEVQDDILEKWMQNAKIQAIDLAQQTIRDLKGVTKAASEGCVSGIKQLVIWVVLINLIFLLVNTCQ